MDAIPSPCIQAGHKIVRIVLFFRNQAPSLEFVGGAKSAIFPAEKA
jgi:hypothetical protein